MNQEDMLVVYETQIEDMLRELQERLDELSENNLDDFELGRKLAFTEMLEIIKNRHKIILEFLE